MRCIDWRTIRLGLEPILDGTGGVVHIRTGPDAAANTFRKVLASIWLDGTCERPWTCVPVAASDPLARFPTELVRKIAKAIGLTLPPPAVSSPVYNIGTGNHAQTINMRNVSVGGNRDQYDFEVQRQSVDALCGELPSFLENNRLALIFSDFDTLDSVHVRRLGKAIWHDHLERFVDQGLLVVITQLTPWVVNEDEFPPVPTTILDLPSYPASAEDIAAAVEDVAAIVIDEGWEVDPGRAASFAKGIVGGADSMLDIHGRINNHRARRILL